MSQRKTRKRGPVCRRTKEASLASFLNDLQTNRVHTVTIKERIWTGQQQICRIDTEDTEPPTSTEENQWIAQINEAIQKFNVSCVVFSDYNKGTLTNKIIQSIVNTCNNNNIPTVLDPKRHTFIDIEGLTVVKPNSREIMSTHMDAMHCSRKLKNTYLLNTLGSQGMRLYKNGQQTQFIPAILKGREVVDVCGAGDTVNAFIGIALANGQSVEDAMQLANHAASIAIRHEGCYVLTRKEILSILTKEENA
jgi:D-beta-D-heptose 7-phosphate kinase/D-beta-D-heptose 1-phosphate adenosyltransferase